MSDTTHNGAWLEQVGGGRTDIQGTCALGRSSSNHVVLLDEKVSRRHSIVHAQAGHEYCLVDLGSRNGTYLNGRRVVQPTLLKDQDQIEIGPFRLAFRMAAVPAEKVDDETVTAQTIQEIKSSDCWLLLADIESSTQLVHSMPAEQLSMITGRWLADCRQALEENHGTINKYLGDGFFAYWHDREATAASVAQALLSLKILQASANPAFRVVMHYGKVFTGGSATLGEESLMGREVNFVFRTEKVAGGLGERCFLSEAAAQKLAEHLPTESLGQHAVPSFEGEFGFFRY
jgi:adenylate cyclase